MRHWRSHAGRRRAPPSPGRRHSSVPDAMAIAHATGRWVGGRTTAARQANAELTAALQEQLAGVRVLRLFGRAGLAVDRVARLSRRQADANLATVRLRSSLQPLYTT